MCYAPVTHKHSPAMHAPLTRSSPPGAAGPGRAAGGEQILEVLMPCLEFGFILKACGSISFPSSLLSGDYFSKPASQAFRVPGLDLSS